MAETSRDPEALQREIERTREELANAIDAISDRVHPANAARRGVSRARGAVSEVFGSNGHKPAGSGDSASDDAGAGGASAVAGESSGTGLPTGYLLAGVGAVVALGAVAFVVVRRRRR